MTDWEQTLTECEARLEAAAGSLGRGPGPDVAPFREPALDQPLPARLVDRAQALVDRSIDLEHRLRDEQVHILAELRRLPRMPVAPRATKFDARG